MATWPRGAAGRTPLSRPGCGACVIAELRLSMLTIGQPHTYAKRPMTLAYAGCMTIPVAGMVTSAALLGMATCPGLVAWALPASEVTGWLGCALPLFSFLPVQATSAQAQARARMVAVRFMVNLRRRFIRRLAKCWGMNSGFGGVARSRQSCASERPRGTALRERGLTHHGAQATDPSTCEDSALAPA